MGMGPFFIAEVPHFWRMCPRSGSRNIKNHSLGSSTAWKHYKPLNRLLRTLSGLQKVLRRARSGVSVYRVHRNALLVGGQLRAP